MLISLFSIEFQPHKAGTMVPQIIPGHITALYIFAILNLMALFHITLVKADISIVSILLLYFRQKNFCGFILTQLM